MNFREAMQRIARYRHQQGTWATVRFLASRLLRHRKYVVFEANLSEPRTAPEWHLDEQVYVIGPETIESHVTPDLRAFLGGEEAEENLASVRKGDSLFVVGNGHEFHHSGYIFFRTKQTKILGEGGDPPLIGCCQTVPDPRGRGLYQRPLKAELCDLQSLGYHRAIIETDPENIASRKGIERAGFRLCRKTTVWILLNRVVLQGSVEGVRTRRRLFVLSQ